MKAIFQISLHIAVLLCIPVIIVAQNPQYQWSNGATTPTIDVSPAQTTTYYVTVTDGSTTFIDSVTITVTTINLTLTTTDVSTCGATDGIISLTIAGGTAPYNYDWSNGNTMQTNNNIPSGSYSVTVTDANGCVADESVTVGAPARTLPVANFTHTQTNASVAFKNTSTNYDNYIWSFGDGNTTDSELNPTYTFAGSGSYTVCLSVFNTCGTDSMCAIFEILETSISELLAKSINIYPNPANNQIFINLPIGISTISLYSIEGKTILQKEAALNTEIIDLSTLNRGVYFLNIVHNGVGLRKKVIKM